MGLIASLLYSYSFPELFVFATGTVWFFYSLTRPNIAIQMNE